MINSLAIVGLGGAAGSMFRYICQKSFATATFPYGTLIVNITGCLLIGIFWGLFAKNNLSEQKSLLLMTGFCGGFTTFSSFTYESIQLLQQDKWVAFISYIGLSVIGGLTATVIGFKITQ
jgi:CrcB protein